MLLWTDYQGRRVRLTDERWRHILDHSELASMQAAIERAVVEPESVVRSATDPTVTLNYRYEKVTLVGDKWLCVVIKYTEDDAFVLTAYLTDRPKSGEVIWRKE